MRSFSLRVVLMLLLLLLIFLQYRLWFEPQGVIGLFRLKKQLTAEQTINERLKQRNMQLRVEVAHLQEGGDAMEAKAREELGMIRKDEIFYHENITEQ